MYSLVGPLIILEVIPLNWNPVLEGTQQSTLKHFHSLVSVKVSSVPVVGWLFLSPPKFLCWNFTPRCDSFRMWDLWEVIRIRWGHVNGALRNWSSILVRVTRALAPSLCSLPHEDATRSQPSATWKRFLTRVWPC